MGKANNKIRGKIIEKFGSQKNFSKAVGLSEQSVTAKLSGKTDLSQDDMQKWAEALEIKKSEIGDYFFGNWLSKR